MRQAVAPPQAEAWGPNAASLPQPSGCGPDNHPAKKLRESLA